MYYIFNINICYVNCFRFAYPAEDFWRLGGMEAWRFGGLEARRLGVISWALLGSPGLSCVLLGAPGLSWMLLGAPLSCPGCSWAHGVDFCSIFSRY